MDHKNYQDHFFKKAKNKGYRSRSAFKLIELNKKFKFLKNRINLLDLGSSPGGWSQVVKENVKYGKILGIDKKETEKILGIKFLIGDFLDDNAKINKSNYFQSKIDVIISDMAPNTTGNKSLDCMRTNHLCLEILNFAMKMLSKKGVVISKLFMGEEFEEIKHMAIKAREQNLLLEQKIKNLEKKIKKL